MNLLIMDFRQDLCPTLPETRGLYPRRAVSRRLHGPDLPDTHLFLAQPRRYAPELVEEDGERWDGLS